MKAFSKWKGKVKMYFDDSKKNAWKKGMHKLDKVSAGRLGFYFSGHQYLPT